MKKLIIVAALTLMPLPSEWVGGDTVTYNMRIKPIPFKLKAVLRVASNDKEGVTLVQEISYKSFKVEIETLMDKETGQVKRMKINGKEQKMSTGAGGGQSETKIITEEESHIKVEAGEFDAIHIVTEDGEGNQTQAWLNPRDVPISGLVKSSTIQGIVTIEMELASFVQGH